MTTKALNFGVRSSDFLRASGFGLRISVSAALLLVLAFPGGAAEAPARLTLKEAHETALRLHPRISVADLRALAAQQVTREVRSAFFPNLSANALGVGTAHNNTRLEAIGALNNPTIYERNAEGLVLSQLLTDFGRTANLTGSARLQAKAEQNNAQATREQILLAVDAAFFSVLRAQAVTEVARQTMAARQVFLEQVSVMASNKLKSELDVSFARVNVEDARLLLVKAQNDLQAGFAQLSTLLGLREAKTWQLVEEPMPPTLSSNVFGFVDTALRNRPDLLSLTAQRDAALRRARAEREARYPTLSAVASAGVAPVRADPLPANYAAAGVVLTMPLYAGGYYAARQHEAELRARAAEESLRDLENNIVRDVRIAWLDAQNAFDRFVIAGQLLDNAKLSYDLAQARYLNALSSIVEINQAQLNLVAAQIGYATTQYEYLIQRSALDYQMGALR